MYELIYKFLRSNASFLCENEKFINLVRFLFVDDNMNSLQRVIVYGSLLISPIFAQDVSAQEAMKHDYQYFSGKLIKPGQFVNGGLFMGSSYQFSLDTRDGIIRFFDRVSNEAPIISSMIGDIDSAQLRVYVGDYRNRGKKTDFEVSLEDILTIDGKPVLK